MERVISHFEETLADLELQINTRLQGIEARKAYGKRLSDDIRNIKKQEKLINASGNSTKFLHSTRVQLTETVQQNTNIVSHLKQDLAKCRHEAYCLTKAIEALK